MIEDIISYISIGVFAICLLAAYIFVIACVLPKKLIHPDKTNGIPASRGIKKFRFENGRAIVYEPPLKVQKYFNQYILSDNNGEKFIKCKIDERIVRTRYTVVAVSSSGKVIDIIDAEEIISQKGCTQAISLPRNTSYVNLIVRDVNGIVVADRDKITFSSKHTAIYIGICAALTALISVIASIAVSIIAKMLLRVGFTPLIPLSLLVGAGIGALYALAVCATYRSSENKLGGSKKK